MATGWCSMTARWCAWSPDPSRWWRSLPTPRTISRASPGISATVTPRSRWWETACASAATMCSRKCSPVSAPVSPPSRRRSSRSAALMTTTATTMASKRRGHAPHLSPLAGRGEAAALYRLMAWLSPAYPVGAFSYSGGLEWAVEAGDVTDEASLRHWLAVILARGSGFSDAVLLAHAHGAVMSRDEPALRAVAELAAALVSSKERHLETTAQGNAFLDATRAAWPCDAIERLVAVWDGPVAYP